MAEALAIFGAVGTTFALLNLARQGYESLAKTYTGFVKAPQNIADIQRRFNNTGYCVQEWSKLWYLDIPMTDELLAAYWGLKATDLIAKQLATVDRKCEDLAAILRPFIPDGQIPEVTKQKIQARLQARARQKKPRKLQKLSKLQRAVGIPIVKQSTVGRSKEEKERVQIFEEYINDKTTIEKKAKFVLSSHQTLKILLDELKRDYDELDMVSKTAWRSKHPGVHWETSDWRQKRIAGLTNVHAPILREAKKDREEIQVLHAFCHTFHDNMNIDINLLRNTSEAACLKRFYLFIPWRATEVALEISAELFRGDLTRTAGCPTQLIEACKVAERAGHSLVRTSSPSSPNTVVCFDLRKTSNNLQRHRWNMYGLANRLETLSLLEKVELAYKVAESGLLLFGTSWLSFLNSKSLHRLEILGQDPRYVMNIKQRTSIFQDQFRTEGWKLERHIFSIGVILLEIALSVAVSSIEASELGINLAVVNEGQTHVWSLLRAFVEVKKTMKDNYADAGKFCLQDPVTASNRMWMYGILYDDSFTEEQKSLELLELYFNRVFVK
ncbi:hypothetical protein MMC21_007625 [Puttea exsequens]|nr:hypothetical protein [Puttea exsequens]